MEMRRPILSAVVNCAVVCTWLMWASGVSAQPVLYVDDSATGTYDGSSWCGAYIFLQDALAAAEARNNDADPTNDVAEIRVAQGVYRPDRDTANPHGTGDREATFELLSGVAVRGVYAACSAPDPDERDFGLYPTVLSGDLAGDDGPDFANNTENSYQVVTGSGTDETAVLDGFVITGGNADGNASDSNGGGMYNASGSPTLQDCVFVNNRATNDGGGMYNDIANPELTTCMFIGNQAGERGGGMSNTTSSPTLANCTFHGNIATLGGGMNNEADSRPTIVDCLFRGNSAGFSGGAIRGWQSHPVITNCAFIANTAEAGGGMWHGGGTQALANCTFFGNSAPEGSALAFDSCCPQQPSDFNARNCILWNGGNEIWNFDDSTITITYSDIQDDEPNDATVYPGTGNMDLVPLFVPGPAGCFYLSQMGAGDTVNSPCVDAGSDTATDLGLDALTTRSDEVGDTGIVDMGYHYPMTGKTLIMGDYDRNERIDLSDIAAFQQCFTDEGPTDVSPCCRIFDFQPDADVDLDDAASIQQAITGP